MRRTSPATVEITQAGFTTLASCYSIRLSAFPKQAIICGGCCGAKLGFRTLMDVIPIDASLVRGSHGRVVAQESSREECPVMIAPADAGDWPDELPVTAVRDVILEAMFGRSA